MNESIKTAPAGPPAALHHSHQYQQMDLGDTIILYAGEGPGGHLAVGEIFNIDDFPCLEENLVEDVEIVAVAIADKIVRSFNCHDALLSACEAHNAFDKHTSDCANCEEFGPGDCGEGAQLFTEAYRLSRLAVDNAKPKAKGGTDASS
jgi:hypothetical protein